MPKISAKHIEFIRLVAQNMPQNEAYRATVGNPKATAKTAKEQGSKIAKKYSKEIQQAKQKDAALVEAAHSSDVSTKALKYVLEASKVDAQLCKVIMGEEFEVKRMNGQGKVWKAKITPECGDILKAIQIYNTRFGLNAPTKIAATNVAGDDIEPTVIVWGGKQIKV